MSMNIALMVLKNIISIYIKITGAQHPKKLLINIVKSDVASGMKEPSIDLLAFSKILAFSNMGKPTLESCRRNIEMAPVPIEFPYTESKHQILVNERTVDIFEITSNGIQDSFFSERSPILVYYHGGGHICGSVKTHMGFLVKFAHYCRCKVFAVDYHLCPEVTLTHQVQECVEAYKYALSKSDRVALCGDSAGGGLVLDTLQSLAAAKVTMPLCSVMITPFVDFSASGESYLVNKDDALVPDDMVELVRSCCIPEGISDKDPKVNGLYRSFKGIQNVYIVASETEAAYNDSITINSKLKTEGAAVIFESAPYGVHIFPLLEAFVPEYKETFHRICSFIRQGLKIDKSFKFA